MAAPPYGSGPPWNPGGAAPPGVPPPPPYISGAAQAPASPYVRGVNYAVNASGTDTFRLPCAIGSGIVVMGSAASSTVTSVADTAGNQYTLLYAYSDGSQFDFLAVCPYSIGNNPNIIVTGGGVVAAAAFEIVGANSGWFVDGYSNSIAGTNVRTTGRNGLILGLYSSNSAKTAPAGYRTISVTVPGMGRTSLGWGYTTSPLAAPFTAFAGWSAAASAAITISIRAAGQYPSHVAAPGAPLPLLPPGTAVAPPGPKGALFPPFFPEVVPAAAPTTPISGSGVSPSTGAADPTLATTGALVALGAAPSEGEASLTGTGALAAPGAAPSTGEANLAGSGALAALGAAPSSGEAFLPVPGMQIVGVSPSSAEASIGGSGALGGDGAAPSSGSASIIGQAPLTALGASPSEGSAALQPQGLKAPGESASAGSAQLLGSGALAALGASASSGSAYIVGPLSALGASASAAAALILGKGALASLGASPSSGSAALGASIAGSGQGVSPSSGAANLQAIAAGTIFARGLSVSSALATITGEVIFEIIPNGISPELPAIYQALRQFIQGVIGGSPAIEVILGLDNRVPMPNAPGFIVITAIGSYRLETNIDTDVDGAFLTPLQTGTMQSNQPTRLEIRIDLYGPDSSDWAIMLGTLFRDDYAVQALAPLCAPLYADEPRMLPLIGAEAQYIEHWILLASVQYDPITVTGLGFATTLNIVPINVDEEFPP